MLPTTAIIGFTNCRPVEHPVELPFTGLKLPFGMAVDTAGNVYVTDYTPRVLNCGGSKHPGRADVHGAERSPGYGG